ncbi:E3 ubiquitin-protein ligase TRIM35-like [Haplochromis burtoni]|uniref:E3 ubiquitin-protein ligase TRIM35-like n=1 Tax=Haplochromis burtoni TaxID=8153 RepID=UPI0003BC7FDB|nr:E3 ubiquitin-protein ligase TRIM35-like [Haplochromis burtoni]
MSSQSEKDLSCPVCHDIYRDPVILSCSHSFCKNCLQTWWTKKQKKNCPLCKKINLSNDPPRNLALKNLCEAFLLQRDKKASAGSEPLCSLHNEKLKLFCLDHQQPVCVVCRDSKAHKDHRFNPTEEAAQDHREELQKHLKPLQDKLKVFEQVKGNFDQTAEHIKVQAQQTEKQIKEEFKKLQQFLQKEEKARLAALRQEEEQKLRKMEEKIESLSRRIETLSETIRATEEQLRAEDVSFLHNYRAAVNRVKQLPLLNAPQLDSGALMDVAKHLGNLTYNIWNKMKEMVSYTPVILDPNTAESHLILSEDLTSASLGEGQKVPHNPERIDSHHCVLTSEGFDSGTHSWDVEVRNDQNRFWGVGVVKESVRRHGIVQSGYWELCLLDGKYTAATPPPPFKPLPVMKLQRVRVQLDCDKKKLTFFDLDTNTHIHTFKLSFTEKLFPYIANHNNLPLKILPLTLKVEQHMAPLSAGFWFS